MMVLLAALIMLMLIIILLIITHQNYIQVFKMFSFSAVKSLGSKGDVRFSSECFLLVSPEWQDSICLIFLKIQNSKVIKETRTMCVYVCRRVSLISFWMVLHMHTNVDTRSHMNKRSMLCSFNALSMSAAEASEKGGGIISAAQSEAQGSGG